MDNREILRIALEQSAIDLNCRPEDFSRKENVVVHSAAKPAARRYLEGGAWAPRDLTRGLYYRGVE